MHAWKETKKSIKTMSKSSILFLAKLSKKNNRMNREDFIAWTRFHLAISQLGCLGNSRTSPVRTLQITRYT